MDRREAKLPRGVFETSPGSNKFGIRVTDANGKRPERVIGTKAEAVKALKEARNKRRRSKVLAPKKHTPTFREIADLAITYAKQEHADPGKVESQLNHFCEGFGDQDVKTNFGDRIAETISKTEIDNWLNEKAGKRDWSDEEWTAVTRGKYRSAIRLSYKEAMRLGFIEVDPTEKIVYKRAPQKEIRDITPEELDRIRASIAIPGSPSRTPAFCRRCLAQLEVARQTGMRKAEQFGATWERINWKRQVLFIPKSKNGDPRDVYLNSYVIAILRALQDDQTRGGALPTGRIFGISNPRKWFDRTLANAQIKGVTWHTLRHNFATHLVHVKVPIKFVQELMGQRDWESTARYIHPDDKDVFAAVASITDNSIPEYLINKSYIREVLDDDAGTSATSLSEQSTPKEELGQVPQVEEPVSGSELLPRMLSRIPREELYDLVWSEPMIHVAQRLGWSNVAVAKACRKRDIPVPGIGYWAKLAAGKPVPTRPTLPPL